MINKIKNIYLHDSSPFIFEMIKYTTKNDTLYVHRNSLSGSKLLNVIMKIHLSKKLNTFFKLPFKYYWFMRFIIKNSKEVKNIVIHARIIKYYDTIHLIERLHKKYQKANLFIYFSDSIKTYDLDLINLKSRFDGIFTYSLKEANTFQLYHQIHPYKLPIETDFQCELIYDIVFVGKSKKRLNLLHQSYLKLKKLGYRLCFYISDVDLKNQLTGENIVYNQSLSYSDYLKIVLQSKAILEILDSDHIDPTLRLHEALYLNKILITNIPTPVHLNYLPNHQILRLTDVLNNQNSPINLNLKSQKINEAILKEFDFDNFVNNMEDKYNSKKYVTQKFQFDKD